ncbi:MAG: branched-chain amino acid ABC transporter permease [Rhizobiaceae bacterium]|nr:branched-chain amino acid ABC transporter permease [Rhizobiaceae bacterium]
MTSYLLAIAIQVGILMILTLSLSIQYGMTGLINFGLVAFYALGAYASGLLTVAGWPIAAGIGVAALVGSLASLPLGFIAVRLKAEYLAIVTLGFAELVRLVALNEQWLTRGTTGLGGIPRPFQDQPPIVQAALFLAVVVFLIVVFVLVSRRLTVSPYGRILASIRDNEAAVNAIGKNPSRFKIQIFAIGSAAGAVAGALQAHYIGYVSPDQFVAHVTFMAWMAMILGGTGRVSGALIGAFVIMLFFEGSRFLRDVMPWISEVEMASVRLAAVGLLLILATLYRPQGIVGDYSSR